MTTAQEIEDWRVKIKKKIWSEFAAEPNEAHGKFLMKKFDELCDTALFGISINSQTTEGTDALAKKQEAEEKHDRTEQVWQLNHTEQIWGLCRTYEQRWKDAERRIKVVEAENARLKAAQQRAEKAEAANVKLVGAIDMIRETLNGSNVQDLLLIINGALDEAKNV